jgi:hypothetical protein
VASASGSGSGSGSAGISTRATYDAGNKPLREPAALVPNHQSVSSCTIPTICSPSTRDSLLSSVAYQMDVSGRRLRSRVESMRGLGTHLVIILSNGSKASVATVEWIAQPERPAPKLQTVIFGFLGGGRKTGV